MPVSANRGQVAQRAHQARAALIGVHDLGHKLTKRFFLAGDVAHLPRVRRNAVVEALTRAAFEQVRHHLAVEVETGLGKMIPQPPDHAGKRVLARVAACIRQQVVPSFLGT